MNGVKLLCVFSFLLIFMGCSKSVTVTDSHLSEKPVTPEQIKSDEKASQEVQSSHPTHTTQTIEKTERSSNEDSMEKIWVYKKNPAKSCENAEGESYLKDSASELGQAGIKIFESKNTHDDKMYMQMCGGPTGAYFAYLISKQDLAKALELGFVEKMK